LVQDELVERLERRFEVAHAIRLDTAAAIAT
jgi:hypothetical protein